MNSALLIVGLVVVGYVFASRLLWLRYRLRLTQGYHTFLFTAAFSVIPVAVALPLVGLVPEPIGPAGVSRLIEVSLSFGPGTAVPEVLTLLLYSLLVAVLLPALAHWVFCLVTGIDKDLLKVCAMYTAEPSPLMVNLLFSSIDRGLPIAFTLKDRKVYVGYPAFISSSLFSPHGSDLHITPLISGYRREDDLTLQFTTPYREVLDELASDEAGSRAGDEFLITIPVSEITHAHLYDPTLQPRFDRHEHRGGDAPAQA